MNRLPLVYPLCFCGSLFFVSAAVPDTPVSYTRQVKPLFDKQCVSCHSGGAAGGGYSLTTRAALLAGGRHGTAVVPRNSAESILVKYLTGELQPRMPSGAPPLSQDTIRLVRRWIDQGAVYDSPALTNNGEKTTSAVRAAFVKPSVPATLSTTFAARIAPTTALGFSPDSKLLAVGGFCTVRLLDAATGRLVRALPCAPVEQVQCLAWSPDGMTIAVGGGEPGVAGRIALLNPAGTHPPRVLGTSKEAQADTVTGVSWRPGTKELASGSLDKSVWI